MAITASGHDDGRPVATMVGQSRACYREDGKTVANEHRVSMAHKAQNNY